MEFQPRTYSGLHDYLDALFEGKTPSKEAIIEAKKVYWRAYNTRLKKQQRERKNEVVVSLSKEEVRLINQRLSEKQTLSGFIKQLVKLELQSNTTAPRNTEALRSLEQHLFLLIEYLEQLLFQSHDLDRQSLKILNSHLDKLQVLFQKHFP